MTTPITAAKETNEYPVSKQNGRRQKSEEDDDDDESAHRTATDLDAKIRKQSYRFVVIDSCNFCSCEKKA